MTGASTPVVVAPNAHCAEWLQKLRLQWAVSEECCVETSAGGALTGLRVLSARNPEVSPPVRSAAVRLPLIRLHSNNAHLCLQQKQHSKPSLHAVGLVSLGIAAHLHLTAAKAEAKSLAILLLRNVTMKLLHAGIRWTDQM